MKSRTTQRSTHLGGAASRLHASAHAVLEGQKGATRPKAATLRVAGYAGAAGILFLIPGHIGNLVWIVTILLNMVGLQKMHRCDQGKAIVSALVASFAIGILYVGVFAVLAAFIFAAIGFSAL